MASKVVAVVGVKALIPVRQQISKERQKFALAFFFAVFLPPLFHLLRVCSSKAVKASRQLDVRQRDGESSSLSGGPE